MVVIPITINSLRRWDETAGRYTVALGAYELRVGPASDQMMQTVPLTVV